MRVLSLFSLFFYFNNSLGFSGGSYQSTTTLREGNIIKAKDKSDFLALSRASKEEVGGDCMLERVIFKI